MQGVTAEYGPARAQKNQTGKWYPQIPVDHTTPQINQRVVNTTLIPVKVKHWAAPRQAVQQAAAASREASGGGAIATRACSGQRSGDGGSMPRVWRRTG